MKNVKFENLAVGTIAILRRYGEEPKEVTYISGPGEMRSPIAPPASEQKPVAWFGSRKITMDYAEVVADTKDGFLFFPLYTAPQPDYKAQRDALLDFAKHIATSPKLSGTGWQEMAQMVVASVKGGAQ